MRDAIVKFVPDQQRAIAGFGRNRKAIGLQARRDSVGERVEFGPAQAPFGVRRRYGIGASPGKLCPLGNEQLPDGKAQSSQPGHQ